MDETSKWLTAILEPLVLAALIAGVVAALGHFVKGWTARQGLVETSRANVAKARIDEAQLELEKQRADIEGLSLAVTSLTTLVEMQGARISALASTLGIAEDDLDREKAYVKVLVRHIEEGLPPPPPPRPNQT